MSAGYDSGRQVGAEIAPAVIEAGVASVLVWEERYDCGMGSETAAEELARAILRLAEGQAP